VICGTGRGGGGAQQQASRPATVGMRGHDGRATDHRGGTMPSKDREDAMHQDRDDLDTHITETPRHTDEEQVRGQRSRRPLPHRPRRKPKNG
jgi:hypothetical protein